MAAGTAMAPAPNPPRPQPNFLSTVRVRVAAKWFYWIAALSMINSLVVMFNGNLHFVVGLGITSLVDALARQAGNLGTPLDLVINAFIAGVFVLLGSFAIKAQKWAFLTGMAFYAADALLCLMAKDILSAGFHAYVLFCLYRGLAVVDRAQAVPAAIPQ